MCIVTIGICQVFQHAEYALGRAIADRFDIAAFLQDFTRDIQRQIVGINHTFDEAQIDWHQLLGVVHDEHAFDIQLDAAALVAIPQIERRTSRDVQQLRVFAATFNTVMRVRKWRAVIMRNMFVEFVVLFWCDIRFAACPQSAGLIHSFQFVAQYLFFFLFIPLFFLHFDRQRNMVRVSADDGLQFPRRQEFIFTFTQVQDDVGTTVRLGNGFHTEITGTFGFPAHAFAGWYACAAGFNGDAVGNDEAGIKTDTELADHGSIFLLIAGEFAEKFFGAGFGDGTQMRNRIFFAHADTVIGNCDRVSSFIKADFDAQFRIVFK